METTFERQCRIYRQQQTVSGKRTQSALESMARQMQEITRKPIHAGTLTPLINGQTGEIVKFIER